MITGKLEKLLDIDITTNDEMLQPFLAANSDNRLKNIVATIQAEQNQIIRADMWKPLVVQGVAGSGKTTIALHRIAYLIYNYEKNFYPEEFLIIAPNKFFLNYISNVLPDLGVERVQQMTYEEIAFEVMGKQFKIEDPNNKLKFLIKNYKTEKEKKQCEIIENTSIFKSSIRYKNLIDEYIYEIEKNFVPEEDFKIGKYIFMTQSEIQHLFYREYSNLPLCRRIEEITKHLINSITMKENEIINDIEDERAYKISKVRFEIKDNILKQEKIEKIYDEYSIIINNISKNKKKIAQEFFKGNRVLDPLNYYKDFIFNYLEVLVRNRTDNEEVKYIKEHFMELQKIAKLDIEDIAPLMYMKYRIHGVKTKFELKHIVIDEAQDFSEFQFYVFKKIVNSNSLTILGDLAQGIYYYRGTRNWERTMNLVFGGDIDPTYLTLKKTYRTTEEIMNTANKIISNLLPNLNCSLGEPVIKSGMPVVIEKFNNQTEMVNKIEKQLIEYRKKDFKNIAIICKTEEACLEMKTRLLNTNEEIHIITNSDTEYKGGINIVPSYLSKGLEFDAVIITNSDKYNYTNSEIDIKLLYVCATRAMNILEIYTVEELTPILHS